MKYPLFMKRPLLWLAVLVYGGAAATGCADQAPAPAPAAFVDRAGIRKDNVSYDNYIGLLLNTRCKTCHNPASPLSTKPALDAWTNEKTHANAARHSRQIVTSVLQNAMPIARPLPVEEIELLRAWLDRGAPEK